MRVTNATPKTPTDLGNVYTRDASFNATGKPSGKVLRRHFAHPENPDVSACCRVLLAGCQSPSEVPGYAQCRLPGCRDGWATVAALRRDREDRP